MKNRMILFLKWMRQYILRIIPDKLYIKIIFRIKVRKKLNLKNPQTFNEKLQWLKLYNRNPKYTEMADKYKVREYVRKKIGEEYLMPLIGIYDKFDDIDFDELPNQFVIKCNHDSGSVVICKDKKNFDIKAARKKINRALKYNYYYVGREWQYKNIERKIMIEEYMEDSKTCELIDYKIMCFYGRPKLLFTCSERYSSGLKVTFFDLNWNKLPFERYHPSSKIKLEKPCNYDLMIKFSKLLSKNIPFVRVDWYEINNKLYFGELTFCPGSGYEKFNPEEWDKIIGSWLTLPKYKDGDVNNE